MTLIEMTVSLAIVSVLMLAMGSAVLVMSRALPNPQGPSKQVSEVQAAVDQFGDEVQYAVLLTRPPTATALEFTVADRDGDGDAELIRYAWAGAGSPLSRTYNGATVSLGPPLKSLRFDYQRTDAREEYKGYLLPPPPFSQFSAYLNSVEGWSYNKTVDDDDWFAQPLPIPTPPARAEWFEINEVRFWGYRQTWNQSLEVQVREETTAGLPITGAAGLLGEVSIPFASLPEGDWEPVTFSPPVQVPAGKRATLVLANSPGSSDVFTFSYDQKAPTSNYWSAYDGSWSRETKRALRHTARGRWITRNEEQALVRPHVTGVMVHAEPQAAGSPPMDTAFPLLNGPAALRAVWESDFAYGTDPLGVDGNSDGQPDWVALGGSLFGDVFSSLGNLLSNGVLAPNRTLGHSPQHPLDRPTIINVRLKTTGGDGTRIVANAHWIGGKYAPIVATLSRESGPVRQKLTISVPLESGSTATYTVHNNLGASDFHDIRLLIDPTRADPTVAVFVNGVWAETYRYWPIAAGSQRKGVMIEPSLGGVLELYASRTEIDSASIRVIGDAP